MSSDVPVGLYRTYVYIPPDQDFTHETWCANLAAGRTFMSGGPIISFSVDGHAIGDTVRLSGNGGTVEGEGWAEAIFPIPNPEVVHEGRVGPPAGGRRGPRRPAVETR